MECCGDFIVDYIRSVSYTHLDVYKRQMLVRSIPGISVSLPLFVIFARTGLLDRISGLILVYTAMTIPCLLYTSRCV